MRCTMSWSVPCVDMVMKVDPISPAKIVYSTSNIPLILSQPCFAGSSPVVKKSEIPKLPWRWTISSQPPGICE